ncbi:hypothetical protein V8D89_004346 [Ganoderma adspersum]
MVSATLVELPFPDLGSSLPTSDLASLVGLDDDGVRAWTSARVDEYRRFSCALLSIYNAVAPIHRLPAEILSKIFEGCWTNRTESLRIGHVCRRWRSVLLDTKRFWADAVKAERFTPDDGRTGFLESMLERSAPCMVKPSFSRFSVGASRYLTPHVGRLLSLEVSCVTKEVLLPLWSCLNSGLPCLTTLTITLDEEDCRWLIHPPIKKLSLSPAALPRLIQVSAPVGLLPSLTRPSIQYLTLHNPTVHDVLDGRLESDSFFGALAVCAANLRTLSLTEATPWLFNLTMTPLPLPALRHLHVQDFGRRCDLLLLHLTLPTPPITRIHCTSINGRDLCSTVTTTSDPVRSVLSTTDRVAIVCAADIISVHCSAGDEELLRIDVGLHSKSDIGPRWQAQAPARVLRPSDLIQFFRDTARVMRLVVAGHNHLDMQSIEWRAFPHLIEAEVRGRKAGYALGNLVRKPDTASASTGPAVVCPGLKVLVLDFVLGPQRTDGLGDALRGGDVAVVEADLRKRCADLEHGLSLRSGMGTRLTRLEFRCTEQGWSESLNGRKSTLDPSGSGWTSWRPIVEPLEKLVDGPVVFTGYRFILADG